MDTFFESRGKGLETTIANRNCGIIEKRRVTMTSKILIVDDEESIGEIISYNLEKEGFASEIAYDGLQCLKALEKSNFDLVLLDVMMPNLDGFQTLQEIRKTSRIPVIMLTAKEEEVDKVLGLELGADDYVVKPFSMRELIARVKTNLRRLGYESEKTDEKILSLGDITIDLGKYEVQKRGQVIDLTLREFELLKFLAQTPDQVYSREELLEKVWGYEYYGDIRTVDVTVRRLREKIEDGDGDFQYILTKRGVGYYFGG